MFLKGGQTNWDFYLGCLTSAYRSTPHESTGLTPNMLMLGWEVRKPIELISWARDRQGNDITCFEQYVAKLRNKMQKAHERTLKSNAARQKEIYDSKVSYHHYENGDIVWYLNEMRRESISPKLQPTYLGPYLIVQKINDLIYKLQLTRLGKFRVVHHNKLKPFQGQVFPKWIETAKALLVGNHK